MVVDLKVISPCLCRFINSLYKAKGDAPVAKPSTALGFAFSIFVSMSAAKKAASTLELKTLICNSDTYTS